MRIGFSPGTEQLANLPAITDGWHCGAVTYTTSLVAEHLGTGLAVGPALRTYVASRVPGPSWPAPRRSAEVTAHQYRGLLAERRFTKW
jgi:hypothetical protein